MTLENKENSDQLFREVLRSASDAIMVMDDAQNIVIFNQQAQYIFGYTNQELIGKPLLVLLPERFRNKHPGHIKKFDQEYKPRLFMSQRKELFGLRKNGNEFPIEVTISKLEIDGDKYFIGILRDITEKKEREERELYLVNHNPITDLPNRTVLNTRLEEMLQDKQLKNKQIALLIMDLDHFREVNNTFGHDLGDLLLKNIAVRLKSILFPGDLVVHLGADEFAVLAPISKLEHTQILMSKITKLMDSPLTIESIPLTIEVSIGLTIFPDFADNIRTLFQQAEMAMYEAKRSKSGEMVYDPKHNLYSPKKLKLITDLRRAIYQNELTLYFQPKINLKTNQVCGVEALLRWSHPEEGMIPPDQFLPLAENTALILPLTNLVFNEAFKQCQSLQRAGQNISVAINLSTRNLQNDELLKVVKGKIEQGTVEVGNMELEITESMIMDDPEHALKVMNRLKSLGFSFSIDDFGTGYSSLTYLKKLPVSSIKIDKSFVLKMKDDKDDLEIVRSTINLGHNLGLTVVAEGVEDQKTYELLAEMGCDYAQGYHMCRPIPSEELKKWLDESNYSASKSHQMNISPEAKFKISSQI